MAGVFDFQSHKTIMRDGHAVGYHVNPYITVKVDGHTINVQNGCFWGSGGDLIEPDDVPSAVWDAIDRWSPVARESVGLEKVRRPGAPVKKAI